MTDKPQTLREAANAWIEANPSAMHHFRMFAQQMLVRNRPFGIGLLAERVRWEMQLRGASNEDFKINNNYRAYIARRLCQDDPRLADLIRFRVTRSADNPLNPPHADQEVYPPFG